MKIRILIMILFCLSILKLSSQSNLNEQLIKFEKSVFEHENAIKKLNVSIDSLNELILDEKITLLDDKGLLCKVAIEAKIKSTPDLFGEVVLTIPKETNIQIVSYVAGSDGYFRVMYNGVMGFMSGIYFRKSCDLELLIKKGIPYNKNEELIKVNKLDKNKASKPSEYILPKSSKKKYHRGERGGCYYYNSSGKKQYVDRSYCN